MSTAFLEGDTALPSILAVICWQFIPFYMILLKAGLTNVPEELYESAKIDGANSWNCFASITMPLLMPTIRTSAVLQLVGSLKYFDLFYVMMGGAPNASTELMATYMYIEGLYRIPDGLCQRHSGIHVYHLLCLCLYLPVCDRKGGEVMNAKVKKTYYTCLFVCGLSDYPCDNRLPVYIPFD